MDILMNKSYTLYNNKKREEETISIVDKVLDKHLKGDLDATIDLNQIDKEYRSVCKKLNFLLDSEREYQDRIWKGVQF